MLILGYNHYRTNQKLKRLRKLSSEKKRITSDLLLASQIQKSMMPLGHRILDGVEGYGTLVPAREIGGDLFDYAIRDGKLYMCIGDVCGKGAPAGMFMAYAHSMIWSLTVGETNPARIVTSLNNLASKDNVSCAFFTLFYGVLDLATGCMQYCNAEFTLQETTLSPGSTIFLYTDGLTEANNAKGEELGPERTQKILEDCVKRQLKPKDIVDTVIDAVHQYTMKAEQSDDLTMLAIRYR